MAAISSPTPAAGWPCITCCCGAVHDAARRQRHQRRAAVDRRRHGRRRRRSCSGSSAATRWPSGWCRCSAGRLGDDHGRRLMFQIGVGGFAATSALAGLAPTAGVLIAARVLQGLAGGLINPQVSGLVQQMFRGDDRGRAFGVLGTTVGVGTALGPLVGGALIALGGPHLGWRLVFFVNVPVGIVVIAARPAARCRRASGRGRHRLDVLGAALLGARHVLRAVRRGRVRRAARRAAGAGWPCRPRCCSSVFFRRERRLTRARRRPAGRPAAVPAPSYTVGRRCWRWRSSRRWPACRWCWRSTTSAASATPRSSPGSASRRTRWAAPSPRRWPAGW